MGEDWGDFLCPQCSWRGSHGKMGNVMLIDAAGLVQEDTGANMIGGLCPQCGLVLGIEHEQTKAEDGGCEMEHETKDFSVTAVDDCVHFEDRRTGSDVRMHLTRGQAQEIGGALLSVGKPRPDSENGRVPETCVSVVEK